MTQRPNLFWALRRPRDARKRERVSKLQRKGRCGSAVSTRDGLRRDTRWIAPRHGAHDESRSVSMPLRCRRPRGALRRFSGLVPLPSPWFTQSLSPLAKNPSFPSFHSPPVLGTCSVDYVRRDRPEAGMRCLILARGRGRMRRALPSRNGLPHVDALSLRPRRVHHF